MIYQRHLVYILRLVMVYVNEQKVAFSVVVLIEIYTMWLAGVCTVKMSKH